MSLISPNSDVKSIFFPNFGQGPFPKIAGKGPENNRYPVLHSVSVALVRGNRKTSLMNKINFKIP